MNFEFVKQVAEYSAGGLELFGIAIIMFIGIIATFVAGLDLVKGKDRRDVYSDYRSQFGHGILLGLEFLVAADIIHTVAVDLTWTSVGVLAIVVVVRTFLSFTLEVEMTGRWPWEGKVREERDPSG